MIYEDKVVYNDKNGYYEVVRVRSLSSVDYDFLASIKFEYWPANAHGYRFCDGKIDLDEVFNFFGREIFGLAFEFYDSDGLDVMYIIDENKEKFSEQIKILNQCTSDELLYIDRKITKNSIGVMENE